MKRFKRILLGILLALVLCLGVLLINAFRLDSKQITAEAAPEIEVSPLAAQHLAEALRMATIGPEDLSDLDSTQFYAFNRFLERTYPLCDSLLDHQIFNEFSHLYRWRGKNPVAEPYIFVAHIDVVPISEDNRSEWKQPPFGGLIVDDTIWGRGAIDDKNIVVGLLEAAELLLAQGFSPEQDLYFMMGHDEEIGGQFGAATMGKHLKEQGVKAAAIFDEGGYITSGLIPNIDQDAAMIGIAEKGYLTLKLETSIEGGHSSIPAPETAVDVMSHAIARLVDHPFPARISPPIEGFIDYIGPELPFFYKAVFANSGLLGSLIINEYEKSPSGNALVRTTISPTIFEAGYKDNVVPKNATAVVNFRILPGESIASVTEYVVETIDDERITVSSPYVNTEPSPVSSTKSFAFQTMQKTLAQIYPGALVSPYLMVGCTDSRNLPGLATDVYRFNPNRVTPDNVKSFHGLNERISVSEFETSVRYFVQLIRNLSAG